MSLVAHALPRFDEADLRAVFPPARDLSARLRGKRVFVTGGTGFIGGWLLESLLYANDIYGENISAVFLTRDAGRVRARRPALAGRTDITLAEGDVRSLPDLPGRFEYIIHAAAESASSLNEDDPAEMLDVLYTGTSRVLEFAKRSRAQRVLLVSSGAVYGQAPSEMPRIPETFAGNVEPLQPRNAYAEGKRLVEQLGAIAQQQAGGEMQITIARCFAFVGPGLPMDGHFAIGNFIRDALRGGPIEVGGDGTPVRSYLYAADLARWLWTILLDGTPMRPYNVGGAEEITIAALANLVRDCLAPDSRVQIARAAVPGARPHRYIPDVSRAKAELGLEPATRLRDAIMKTATFQRAVQAASEGRTA